MKKVIGDNNQDFTGKGIEDLEDLKKDEENQIHPQDQRNSQDGTSGQGPTEK